MAETLVSITPFFESGLNLNAEKQIRNNVMMTSKNDKKKFNLNSGSCLFHRVFKAIVSIGMMFFVSCSGNYKGKDYSIKTVVDQEKGYLDVSSREYLEWHAIKKLKRAGKYNEVEWEIEKTMLPAYGLITYDPSYDSEITYMKIENSEFKQTCKEKRDKKNADYSGDDSAPFTILPIPGVGVFVGVNTSFGQGAKQSFSYFFCKPRSNLPDSTTIYMKNKMDQTINKYLVTKKKPGEKEVESTSIMRRKRR